MPHDDLQQAAAGARARHAPGPVCPATAPHAVPRRPSGCRRAGLLARCRRRSSCCRPLLPPRPMARVGSDRPVRDLRRGWTGEPLAFDYRLRFTWPDGSASEAVDPYRFGRVLTDYDLYLLGEGTQLRAQEKLGAQPVQLGIDRRRALRGLGAQRRARERGRRLQRWDGRVHPMRLPRPARRLGDLRARGSANGEKYKFEIRARGGAVFQKADPYARRLEVPPRSASIVWHAAPYAWGDGEWMERRAGGGRVARRARCRSTRCTSGRGRAAPTAERFLSYRELADRLVPYVRDMGFTHIELLPVMEHPFAGSWGYQVIGFFAPPARGSATPEDFKAFVDACHRRGRSASSSTGCPATSRRTRTAWRGSTAPRSTSTRTRGRASTRTGARWSSTTGVNEVRSFLLSNALFWLERVPHRRPARGRRRVDALPGLLAARRAVDPQPLRRPREPRGDRLPARS